MDYLIRTVPLKLLPKNHPEQAAIVDTAISLVLAGVLTVPGALEMRIGQIEMIAGVYTRYTNLALLQKAVREARDLVPYLEPLNENLQAQKMRLLTLLDTALDKGELPLPQTTEGLKAAFFAAIETGIVEESCLKSLSIFEGCLWQYLAANYASEQVLYFFTQVADARAWYDELYDLNKQKRLAAIYGPEVELGKHVVEYETPHGTRHWIQCTDLPTVLEFCQSLGWKVWVNGINR